MKNKKENENLSDKCSPFEDERLAWEDWLNSFFDCDNYEMPSYYDEFSHNPSETINTKSYDLDRFEFPTSFVSIDFETLYAQRVSACSVGLVKYKNGLKYKESFYRLIRPPFEYEGKCGPALTWIHGFTEDMLKNEKTFAEILPEMEEYIEGLPLVAHNACVERACIHDACTYYNIATSIPYDDIMDTYLLSKKIEEKLGMNVSGAGSHSLDAVCQRFGVKELHHHHACDDAAMCGNLFLIFPKFLSGELVFDESAWRMASENCAKDTLKNKIIHQSYASKGHSILCGDILKKDLTCADPNNPFYDRKLVITGVFNIDRQELACILKTMGADIDKGVSSKTNYLLVGEEPGPSKLRKFDELISKGKDVRKIYQDDLDLILAGMDYEKYRTEITPPKPKVTTSQERKTTWPNLVEKFKQYVDGKCIEFSERELQSEDYRLLSLYYRQQQKISTEKVTVLANLRMLDETNECEFRKDILACFFEGENVSKKVAYERMQNVFDKFGLQFKAKTCVLTEFGVKFEEYNVKGIHYLTIKQLPLY